MIKIKQFWLNIAYLNIPNLDAIVLKLLHVIYKTKFGLIIISKLKPN